MEVVVRNPRFKVRAVTRQHGPISDEEFRGAVISFTVDRSLNQDAGTFSLTMTAARPPARFGVDSWAYVLEPMDYVELWAWVPHTNPVQSEPDRPLMRGFVDTPGKTFSISGGTPEQAVQITGRDYGKLALITKLYYTREPLGLAIFNQWSKALDEMNQVENQFGEVSPKFGAFVPPVKVLKGMFDGFLTPQVQAVMETFKGSPLPQMTFDDSGIDKDREDRLRCYNPKFQILSSIVDLWPLFRSYQHAPWRELFFDEGADGPVLIYRETPWLDKAGNQVQKFAASVKTIQIAETDVMESGTFRSDEAVLNFMTTLSPMTPMAAMAKTQGQLEGGTVTGFQRNPVLIGYGNDPGGIGTFGIDTDESAWQRHGIRIRDFNTPYLDVEIDQKEEAIVRLLENVRAQGGAENLLVVAAMNHGAMLESGSMTLKGDDRIRIGNYIDRAGIRAYCTGVSHTFHQGTQPADGRFITRIALERGRGYMVATKKATG